MPAMTFAEAVSIIKKSQQAIREAKATIEAAVSPVFVAAAQSRIRIYGNTIASVYSYFPDETRRRIENAVQEEVPQTEVLF